MEPVLYKGYSIQPRTMQLRDTKAWTLGVHIMRDSRGSVRVQPFTAGNTFSTREEAEKWCVRFGQDIIDAKVAGCSVDGL